MRWLFSSAAALSGGLFGAGLYVSQMVDPHKVLRFLDVTAIPRGEWDPSLAFVMLPGVLIMFVAVRLAKRRGAPWFDGRFHDPDGSRIDAPLIAGSALFGIGWGMSGLCPGPALALIAFAPADLWIFLAAMVAGMLGTRLVLTQGRTNAVGAA